MRFRLWIGGMEDVTRVSVIQMLMTDEEDMSSPPRFPKILYVFDVPCVWFWGVRYEIDSDPPELPPAFDSSYFSIMYDYTIDEVTSILGITRN